MRQHSNEPGCGGLYLRDFKPSRVTIGKADIENVVGEFRQFLETALDGYARAESTIVEIR